MQPIPSLLLATLLATAIVLAWRHRVRRRRRAYAHVLDAADTFEARLRIARAQIGQNGGDPVRDALQEMLRQRLWLQQHGASADVAALDAMRESIGNSPSWRWSVPAVAHEPAADPRLDIDVSP